MKAKDIMTTEVITVAPSDTIEHAMRLMLQKRISGLPVVDSAGQLVGMVTEGDFLRRTELGTERKRPRWLQFCIGPGKLATEYVHEAGRTIDEVMTQDVVSAGEDAALQDIVAMMERHRIKRVPIVRAGKLVGIVTRVNLLHALATVAHEIAPSPANDAAIRERIVSELKKQSWAPLAMIDVIVRNGVATISGVVTDERQRQALRVLCENVAGVKKIEDHLVWVEPMSGMVIEGADEKA